jgi:FkbM family methyltransferase
MIICAEKYCTNKNTSENKMLKYLNFIFLKFGYEIVSKAELDKLIYNRNINLNIKKKSQFQQDIYIDVCNIVHNEKPVIFDVGAYIGDVAKKYLEVFPSSILYAFEPAPASFAQLKENLAKAENVNLFNLAVSDSNRICDFFINSFSPTNSLYEADERAKEIWGNNILTKENTIRVKSIKIDTFCKTNFLNKIDILKLDVQGGELSVLNGAEEMLKEKRIKSILLEALFAPTYKNQSQFVDVYKLLHSHDYQLHNIYTPKEINGKLIQMDVIFTSEVVS